MEYDLHRSTRKCAATGRDLLAGEEVYTALVAQGADLVRLDYAADAWPGPPEGAIGWWKSRIPSPTTAKARLAPNDVILQLFDQLAEQPDKADMRYVLALLLIRRRVMRLEDTERGADGRETLVLYCARREESYRVAAVVPSADRQQEIQRELEQLLFAR